MCIYQAVLKFGLGAQVKESFGNSVPLLEMLGSVIQETSDELCRVTLFSERTTVIYFSIRRLALSDMFEKYIFYFQVFEEFFLQGEIHYIVSTGEIQHLQKLKEWCCFSVTFRIRAVDIISFRPLILYFSLTSTLFLKSILY